MDLKKYNGYIFDVDGTLYPQTKMRVIMLKRLLLYYICRPHKIQELLAVYFFRKLREKSKWKCASFEELYLEISRCTAIPRETIEKSIQYWIFQVPLDIIKQFAYTDVVTFINRQHQEGKQIFIYSDYPAKDKLQVMGIAYNELYAFGENGVDEQKPSQSVMSRIISESSYEPVRILYVGNRDDRDKASAELVHIPYCDIKDFRRLLKKR